MSVDNGIARAAGGAVVIGRSAEALRKLDAERNGS